MKDKKIRVNVYSDSLYFPKSWYGGVHSAFLNHVRLLQSAPHLFEFSVNSRAKGDVYHFHTLGPFSPLISSYKTPAVSTAHITLESISGSSKGHQHISPLLNRYTQWFFNHTDLVLAVSPESKKFLSKQGITSPIEVFPNPIDTSQFKSNTSLRKKGRKLLNLDISSRVVLSVGYLQSRKGFLDFVEVARKCPEYTFVWAGGKSFGISDISVKNTPPNLYLTRAVPYTDMPSVYNAADIFLFPSYQENGSMAIIEAASCGLPLLLRDLTSYKTLYGKGFMTGATREEFITTVHALMTKKSRYANASHNAIALSQKYRLEVLADSLHTIYRSLLS